MRFDRMQFLEWIFWLLVWDLYRNTFCRVTSTGRPESLREGLARISWCFSLRAPSLPNPGCLRDFVGGLIWLCRSARPQSSGSRLSTRSPMLMPAVISTTLTASASGSATWFTSGSVLFMPSTPVRGELPPAVVRVPLRAAVPPLKLIVVFSYRPEAALPMGECGARDTRIQGDELRRFKSCV